MSENTKLWDAVCFTDPETTKKVKQRGGFTAIDAQSQLKRATQLWGPYGDEWGLSDLEWEWIRNGAGELELLSLDAMFFYPHGNVRQSFDIGGELNYAKNNDNKKKLLTDTMTKALSKLGFNSDVFEGLYDDFNYVARMKEMFATGELSTGKQLKPGRPKGPPVGDKALCDLTMQLLQFIHGQDWREQGSLLAQEVTRETRPDDTQSLITKLTNEEINTAIDRLRIDADARKLTLPDNLGESK